VRASLAAQRHLESAGVLAEIIIITGCRVIVVANIVVIR